MGGLHTPAPRAVVSRGEEDPKPTPTAPARPQQPSNRQDRKDLLPNNGLSDRQSSATARGTPLHLKGRPVSVVEERGGMAHPTRDGHENGSNVCVGLGVGYLSLSDTCGVTDSWTLRLTATWTQ